MSFFDSIVSLLDPIFFPLVKLSPFFAVLILSFLLALLISWVYKKMTDQHVMKALKEEMKKLQEQLKKDRNNTSKMMDVQKKLMEKNKQYLVQSFKPALVTMIPIIIIYAWFNAHLGYDAIHPNTEFEVGALLNSDAAGIIELEIATGKGTLHLLSNKTQTLEEYNTKFLFFTSHKKKATWKLTGEEGEYTLSYKYGNETKTQQVLITNDILYKPPVLAVTGDSNFQELYIGNKELLIIDFSFIHLTWLWSYLIFSIIFSLLLRKWMKIY